MIEPGAEHAINLFDDVRLQARVKAVFVIHVNTVGELDMPTMHQSQRKFR